MLKHCITKGKQSIAVLTRARHLKKVTAARPGFTTFSVRPFSNPETPEETPAEPLMDLKKETDEQTLAAS